jgi:hypothetical protein
VDDYNTVNNLISISEGHKYLSKTYKFHGVEFPAYLYLLMSEKSKYSYYIIKKEEKEYIVFTPTLKVLIFEYFDKKSNKLFLQNILYILKVNFTHDLSVDEYSNLIRNKIKEIHHYIDLD